jgi:peptidoglycan/xylan/chitin deacetylase (PgdA/CDA1 family)
MYHYIRVNPDPADKIGFGLSVTPADFAAQMAFLADRGYKTIALDQLGSPEAATGKAVVITFDDGYADAFAEAAPVLAQYGFKGTFYIITALVDAPRYLTWDQIRALAADGHTIGSHTVGHPDLRTLGPAALQAQLQNSRAVLEEHLGRPVLDFCYPAGKFNAAVEAAVGAAGYRTAVTTRGGWSPAGEDSLALTRVRVSGGMSLVQFAEAIGEVAP